MSLPIGLVWKNIQKAQRLQDYEFAEDIVRATQMASEEICKKTDWAGLRETQTVVYTKGTPVLLANDTLGVVSVLDSDGALVRRSEVYSQGTDLDDGNANFYAITSGLTSLASGKGISITQGSTVFTGPAFDSALIGEDIELDEQPCSYRLATELTLEEPYNGPNISNGYYNVRPRDAKLIDFGESGTYTVVLWRREKPMYLPHQRTVLPETAFFLQVVIRIIGFHEKQESVADNYRREYEKALADAIFKNPRYYPPANAIVQKGGYARKFGRSFR